jgi:uncharacterized membrane protein YfcA
MGVSRLLRWHRIVDESHVNEILLLSAGILGGALNAVAGGGSFVTFPALLLAGLPPVTANATNTFASCAGYLSGAYALRGEVGMRPRVLLRMLLLALVGGALGAWLLLQVSAPLFREAIPWLLLFALALFVFGPRMNRGLRRFGARHQGASLAGSIGLGLALLAVSAYGGFFNAGLGIVILSYLALAGHDDINAMNGIKLLLSAAASLAAIGLFAWSGKLAWYAGGLVLVGTLVGGYLAARVSRRLPQSLIRAGVVAAGLGTVLYYLAA